MVNHLIINARSVNEGRVFDADLRIRSGRIDQIGTNLGSRADEAVFDAAGRCLMPGMIDCQVHFREPGLTHKGDIGSESRAAVAGGITSYMEMPNTSPWTGSMDMIGEKCARATQTSLANLAFYRGATNDNLDDGAQADQHGVAGIKVFMGASTGNMLVDREDVLDAIFRDAPCLIATHCEDESIIRGNIEAAKASGRILTAADHPIIRDEEACYESSLYAIQIAKKYGTRLHILHITTEKELQLFTNMFPLKDKRITSEVCVHHLHFTSDDYARLGNLIKCNPAIKAPHNKEALWKALLDDRLDVIATDHAPHTLEEKNEPYEKAHAGLPLVQHPLLLMLHYYKEGRISLEKIVEKMSHAVADCFQVKERGYIREGYHEDLVMVDLNNSSTVSKDNILYKCGWSPLENFTFPASITHTFINGHLVYDNGKWNESQMGQRLKFERN